MSLRALLLLIFLVPTSDPVVDAIIKEERDHSRVMDYLDHLVNKIGPRLTSSTNLTKACEWTRGEFEKMGLKARLEEWGNYPVGFDRGPWSAKMVDPEPMDLTIGFNAWMPGTSGPLTGPAVLAPETDEELQTLKPKLKGAWVISATRGPEKYRVAYDEAGIAGVIRSAGGELILTSGMSKLDWDKLPTRVTVSLIASQHKKIVELLKAGKDVTLTIDIKVEFKKGPIKVYNVIAELPGTEKPDELVIVGGHIDSWDGATGTTDNGTGVATTLEAARLLSKAGAKPKRTIRFMLWSGEEQGLLGSRAYIRAHPEETPKVSAVLVHDGGTNYASGINATEAMLPLIEKAMEPLVKLDGEMKFTVRKAQGLPFGIGSDHDSYLGVGVPGFYWLQSGRAKYNYGHHTQHDTYELAIPDYQRQTAMVVAVGALGIANLDDLVPRTGLRSLTAPPKRKMIGVQLDDMMQIVELVEGAPAEKAGLKVGDKLLKFNGKDVGDVGELSQAIQTAPKQSKIVVQREGKEQELPVTLPD
jgi:hypothetical protein